MFKKALLSLLLLGSMWQTAEAGCPVRRTFVHQQPGGEPLTVSVSANSRYTLYTSADGMALLRGTDGHYYYAIAAADGTLAPTTVLAANNAPQTAAQWLRADEAARRMEAHYPEQPLLRSDAASSARSLTPGTADGLGAYGISAKGSVSSIGAPKLPVIMVNFADRAFQDTITAEKTNRFFNEQGYHDERYAIGSVRDYFTEQSYGLFTPSFEVVANITLSNKYAYYGKDASNGSHDINASAFLSEAFRLASEQADFTPFCTEGTNQVPMAVLMFAGPGQQSSFEDGHNDYLWAKYSQTSYTVNSGKVRIASYFMGNELLQSYGQHENDIIGAQMESVGLYCHEFGHALGLPDFYSTSGGSYATMGYRDIMDYGQYYMDGYRPLEYSAYERSYMGWLKVTELANEAQAATLVPLSADANVSGHRAFVVRNPEKSSEYYIFENRQVNPWYAKRLGTGLLITHVDYDASAWNGNRVNTTETHQRISYVPADNVKEGSVPTGGMSTTDFFNGYKADLFPGTTNATQFTDETVPAASLFNGTSKLLSRPIYNIAETADGLITFSYLDATLTGVHSATVNGESTAPATVYDLSGRRVSRAGKGVYIVNGKKVLR